MAVQAWKTIIAQKEKGDPKAPKVRVKSEV
jgi:hypothetical protein